MIRTGGAAKKLLLQTKPRISELFGARVLGAFSRENVRLQFGICANESLSLKLIGSTLQNTPRVGPPTRFRTRPKITPTTEAATARYPRKITGRAKTLLLVESENDFARAFATYRLETNQMHSRDLILRPLLQQGPQVVDRRAATALRLEHLGKAPVV